MREWVIEGLPTSILQDAWWMEMEESAQGAAHRSPPREAARGQTAWQPMGWAGALLLGLTAAADGLFFGHPAGLSVAVFLILLGAALDIAAMRRPAPARPLPRHRRAAWALLALGAAPVIVALTPLALIFAGLAGLGAAALFGGPAGRGLWAFLEGAGRIAASVPLRGLRDTRPALKEWRHVSPRARQGLMAVLGAWAMPVVMATGFLFLLMSGNPLLSDLVLRLSLPSVDPGALLRRLGFWLIAAALIWPLLAPALAGRLPGLRQPRAARPILPRGTRLGFTPEAIGNALVLFNALFAVQSAMDLAYLWGGVALPDGMSHATYAHKGAYPLVATALLAGAFALIARPHLAQAPRLRALLVLWIGQNVLLVVSSLLRLELYVTAYGLTHLRLGAAIWMGLVAGGLAVTLWQIARAHGNRWLLARVAVMAGAVLYACAFLNAPGVVARVNLARAEAGLRVDPAYVCALGPMAAAEILRHNRGHTRAFCLDQPALLPPQITGWRDWGLRKALIRRYALTETGRPPVAPPRLLDLPAMDPRL